MFLVAIPSGMLIGLSLGTLGGGGSILTVPALVYLLGFYPHTATTSSLLIVGITSLIGLVPHVQAGRVRTLEGVVFGVLGVVGSFVGSELSAVVPGEALLAAFAVLILVVSIVMLRRVRRMPARSSPDGPGEGESVALLPLRKNMRVLVRVVVAATIVGVLTGFFGVGGGFVLVPALTLALGYSTPTAVGTSLLVIVINSLTALVFRVGDGWDFDWIVIGIFIATAICGSLLGGRLAGWLSNRHLTTAFAVLLIGVACYTGGSSVLALS